MLGPTTSNRRVSRNAATVPAATAAAAATGKQPNG
jgi:hypothetical protein